LPIEPEAALQNASKLLALFALLDALFAVDALRVQEIIRLGPITPVHHAPEHVLGIINLRGRIVTVLDPALRMGLGAQEQAPRSRILIVDWKDEQVGLLVSRVEDMVEAAPDAITAPPTNLKSDLGAYLSGVLQLKDHMVSILDLEPLLSVDEAS
jgi:purine-binding chemotaxis protein CheW